MTKRNYIKKSIKKEPEVVFKGGLLRDFTVQRFVYTSTVCEDWCRLLQPTLLI